MAFTSILERINFHWRRKGLVFNTDFFMMRLLKALCLVLQPTSTSICRSKCQTHKLNWFWSAHLQPKWKFDLLQDLGLLIDRLVAIFNLWPGVLWQLENKGVVPMCSLRWQLLLCNKELQWDDCTIGHVNNIPTMQFFTGISRYTQSKSYMVSLTECVWEFRNNV